MRFGSKTSYRLVKTPHWPFLCGRADCLFSTQCDGVVPVFPWPFRRIERPAERKWRAWDDFRQETISAIFELLVVFVGECKSREIREAE